MERGCATHAFYLAARLRLLAQVAPGGNVVNKLWTSPYYSRYHGGMDALTDTIIVGDFTIRLRRNARSRRLTLRIAPDGPVLTIPKRLPMREAEAFARKQEPWLRAKTAKLPDLVQVRPGATIPVEGDPVGVVSAPIRGVRLDHDQLLVGGSPEQVGSKVAAWLKELARDRVSEASDRYARAIGVRHAGITLRDTRSRWGSCTHEARLMYSWRLIMAPPDVLDYVAAHEVAHIRELNHSPAYWAVVASMCPDYDIHRNWLKREGASLHRYRF